MLGVSCFLYVFLVVVFVVGFRGTSFGRFVWFTFWVFGVGVNLWVCFVLLFFFFWGGSCLWGWKMALRCLGYD